MGLSDGVVSVRSMKVCTWELGPIVCGSLIGWFLYAVRRYVHGNWSQLFVDLSDGMVSVCSMKVCTCTWELRPIVCGSV